LGAFRVDHSKPIGENAEYNEVRNEKHKDKLSVKMLKENDAKLEGHLVLLNKALERLWRPQDSSTINSAVPSTTTTVRSSLIRRLSVTNLLPRPSNISSFVTVRLSQTSNPKLVSGQSSPSDVQDHKTDDNDGRGLVEKHGLTGIQGTSVSGTHSKQLLSDDFKLNDNIDSDTVPIATVLTTSSYSSTSSQKQKTNAVGGGKVNLHKIKTAKPPSVKTSIDSKLTKQANKTRSTTRVPCGSTNTLPRPSTTSSFVKDRFSQTSKPKKIWSIKSGRSSHTDVHDDEIDDIEAEDLVEIHRFISIQDTSISGIESKELSSDKLIPKLNDNFDSDTTVSSASFSSSTPSQNQKVIAIKKGGKLQKNTTPKLLSGAGSIDTKPTKQVNKTSSTARTPSGSTHKLISKSTSASFGTVI
jgi:hypothetical protein